MRDPFTGRRIYNRHPFFDGTAYRRPGAPGPKPPKAYKHRQLSLAPELFDEMEAAKEDISLEVLLSARRLGWGGFVKLLFLHWQQHPPHVDWIKEVMEQVPLKGRPKELEPDEYEALKLRAIEARDERAAKRAMRGLKPKVRKPRVGVHDFAQSPIDPDWFLCKKCHVRRHLSMGREGKALDPASPCRFMHPDPRQRSMWRSPPPKSWLIEVAGFPPDEVGWGTDDESWRHYVAPQNDDDQREDSSSRDPNRPEHAG